MPQASSDLQLDDGHKTNRELQNANMARIVKHKDLGSLYDFGSARGFAEALDSDLENGLPSDEGDCRLSTCKHYKTDPPDQGFLHYLWNGCNKYMIFLLLLCAVLSIGFGIKEEGPDTGWYEGCFLLNAVIILVAFPTIREFWIFQFSRSKRHLLKNKKMAVRVLRGGSEHMISISKVVFGEIVCLETGDQVPADGLFITGEFLRLDDEEQAVIDERNPFMFHGSLVVSGKGRMLVTSVGKDTVWGEMMSKLTNVPNKKTPLQVQLNSVNTYTQIMGLLISILILVVVFLRFKLHGSGFSDIKRKPATVSEFIDAIEKIIMKPKGKIKGIPCVVTLAITNWNKKTLSSKCTVQDPLACVTMGSVTTICTDKTGGLTQNHTEVEVFYIGEKLIKDAAIAPIVREALWNGISMSVVGSQSPSSIMEDPLLSWASSKLDMKMEALKHEYTVEVKPSNAKEVCEMRMKKNGDKGGNMSSHWKGSATEILTMCSHYYDSGGNKNVIDMPKRSALAQIIHSMQVKNLEAIAFCYMRMEAPDNAENEVVLLGLLGLKHSSRRAIKSFTDAGVQIKLVSDSDVVGLESIASKCRMLGPNQDLVVSGEKFRNFSDEERMKMVDKICVLGNSLPSDKLLLVQCLRQKGHVVAVVGGRTDETPALKEADVAITTGNRSTKAARESSSLFVFDNSSHFIIAVIRCGRGIYENIQKFIQLELTATIAWFLINSIISACFGDAPITTIQLSWVWLVVAALGGLALLTEPPKENLMKKPPVKQTDFFVTRTMWRNIILQALYQTTILVILQFKGHAILDINQKVITTMIFNSFVLCQVFNMFNAREMEKKNIFKGIHKNYWFWVAVVVTILLQEAHTEVAHYIFNREKLNFQQWAICLLIGVVSGLTDWTGKYIFQLWQ
ncbi:Calcium-transporting ATPase [Bertholletia excelsa]